MDIESPLGVFEMEMWKMKNRFRFITQMCLIFVLSLIVINQSAAFTCACVATAQESTQIANKLQLIKQLAEQIQMVKNQYQMLQQLTSGLTSGLNGANQAIMVQFSKVQDLWKSAKSLTHVMDDFETKHNQRHPEHKAGMQVNADEEWDRRYKESKEMMDKYLYGINMRAKDFESRERARQKLFEVLASTEGQVQAIQALGALINHTSVMIDQNTEVLSGYVTMFAENEQDKKDEQNNARKNMQLALERATKEQPTGREYRAKPVM